MENNELGVVYRIIMEADCPEKIFGASALPEVVKKIYRQLARVLHPDLHQNNEKDKRTAEEAFKKLNEFYEMAQEKTKNGSYGDCSVGEKSDSGQSDFIIKTRKAEYHIQSVIARGDLSVVYNGYFTDDNGTQNKVAVKVIDDPADNDLAQNEIRVLRMLSEETGNQKKHLPVIIDQFKTADDQIGIVLRQIDGHDVYSIREKERYKNGVPQKHVVWMFNRLLSALGFVHSKGIIHGNIDPSHLMVRPKDHNLFLIDWSYAVINPLETGDGFKVYTENFSAPEVKDKKPPIPASDLYSVGKCMIYLLGGDLKTNKMPPEVDVKLQRFIRFFVMESPLQRAQDAWQMHKELIKLIEELWGPRRFLEFEI